MQFDENSSTAQKNLIAEGGEGKIYTYQQSIIKVFKSASGVDFAEKQHKLDLLMNKQLPASAVVPTDLVYDLHNRFIGYKMRRVKGDALRILANKKFIAANNVTKKDILGMLVTIGETLDALHAEGIVIGDLSDLNILFDDRYRVWFIDVDSWGIGPYPCAVTTEAFTDPYLQHAHFTPETDDFAFAVLVYKLLTRLHPFGGTLPAHPTMSLTDRMQQGLTVIKNPDAVIPVMVDRDVFLPARLIDALYLIFTAAVRQSLSPELTDFAAHLTYCNAHADYYYSQYPTCPVCNLGVTEIVPITNVGTVNGIPVRVILDDPLIKLLFTDQIFLTTTNEVHCRASSMMLPYERGAFYYVNDAGTVMYVITDEEIRIHTSAKVFTVPKHWKSEVVVRNNEIYYISESLFLMHFTVAGPTATGSVQVGPVSLTATFNVIDPKCYFVCNSYDQNKILNVSGHMFTFENTEKIVSAASQYDPSTKTWLFVFETAKDEFVTMILNAQQGILEHRTDLTYLGSLGNLCYARGIIYKPSDSAIIGFNYKTNNYKDFKMEIVTADTKLIAHGDQFIAVTDKMIYEIG